MDFVIEYRGGVRVLVWNDGGCRPATDAEVIMWAELRRVREAPVAIYHGDCHDTTFYQHVSFETWDEERKMVDLEGQRLRLVPERGEVSDG